MQACPRSEPFGLLRIRIKLESDFAMFHNTILALLEFGGEPDHVHLLVDIHPALDISVLINNLKTASARRARSRFAEHLAPFYVKPLFWHRAYFVGSVGGATLETVRAYVDAQGTEEHARKSAAKAKSKKEDKPSA